MTAQMPYYRKKKYGGSYRKYFFYPSPPPYTRENIDIVEYYEVGLYNPIRPIQRMDLCNLFLLKKGQKPLL